MSAMSPAMDAALAGLNPTIFGAIEIVLPDHAIRLLSGSGIINFGGNSFTGRDATYGTLISIDALDDGIGDDAPTITITLAPASDAASADLASAAHQGAQVSIWLGVVDPATGLVIGDPLLIFLGALDTATIESSSVGRFLEFEVTSAFEWFFFNDDGARLSDTFHRYLWPNEAGLSQVTGILHQIYWGSKPPTGVSR